jgi:hypothetical protein
MSCTTNLFKAAFRFSAVCAFLSVVCAQSFAGIIVTPVLRSAVAGAGVTRMTIDIYGQGSPAQQSVGAFGLQIGVSGVGTRSNFAFSAPGTVALSGVNSFRELANLATGGSTAGSDTGATSRSFTVSRSAFQAPNPGVFPENVAISSAAIPANFAAQEANRLIATVAFDVNLPGAYTITTASSAVGAIGNGFFVQNGDNVTYSPIAGTSTFATGVFSVAVPEPSSIALLAASSIFGIGFVRRRMKKAKAV